MVCPVRPVELPGRGVGLVAVRDIAPGEVVIQEEPLILYPNELLRQSVCGCCLRMLVPAAAGAVIAQQQAGPCPACGTRCARGALVRVRSGHHVGSRSSRERVIPHVACRRFCSAACEAAATNKPGGAHRPCVCRGMVAARQRFSDEEVQLPTETPQALPVLHSPFLASGLSK